MQRAQAKEAKKRKLEEGKKRFWHEKGCNGKNVKYVFPYLICTIWICEIIWNILQLSGPRESSSSEENERSDYNEVDDEDSDDFDRPKAKQNIKGVFQPCTWHSSILS